MSVVETFEMEVVDPDAPMLRLVPRPYGPLASAKDASERTHAESFIVSVKMMVPAVEIIVVDRDRLSSLDWAEVEAPGLTNPLFITASVE